MVRICVDLTGEIRSFERVEVALKRLGHRLDSCTIRRLAEQVGGELSQQQAAGTDSVDRKSVVVPEIAVVSCDGGRIRVREPGHGPGVFNAQWRETKNASFERKTGTTVGKQDPCPELPSTFAHPERVASMAESPELDVTVDRLAPEVPKLLYRGPKRILRTCISSMSCSVDFGVLMQREAERRRFYESERKAFVGDGLGWNWTIWREHFRDFEPILDFVHAVRYIFSAARAVAENDRDVWASYVRHITMCWQGRVEGVILELTEALERLGVTQGTCLPDEDRRKPLADAIRYLTNNKSRMNYPKYRKLGLPVTSSPMESLIKQINLRVKGTEMTWNDPRGAEAILQIRAAALSDDARLDDYLSNRPGWHFVRRTTPISGTTAA